MATMPVPTSHTLADLVEAFQVEFAPDLADETRRTMTWFCRRILGDFGGSLPLERISSVMLRSWKNHLSKTLKPGTVHQYMDRLDILLKAAHKELKWITVNPLS